jgi:type VI protein secretion system component Hcp
VGSGDERRSVLRRVRDASLAPWKLLLPAAALLGAGAAVAIGDIPGSGGTIIGCANTAATNIEGQLVPFGTLRVLDPSDTTDQFADQCASVDEETVTWSVQGPPGPQGIQGVPGANGANGAGGPNGKDGAPASILDETNFTIDSSASNKLYLKLSGVNGSLELKGTPAAWSQVTNTANPIVPAAATASSASGVKQTGKAQTIAGLIPLGSFQAGEEASTTTAGTASSGAGAGKAVQTFVLTKAADKTDAELAKDLFHHTTLKSLQLIVTHGAGQKQVQAADYTLTDVQITNMVDTGRPGKDAEEVIGVFTKMTGDVGTGSNTVPTSWNQVKNDPTPSGAPVLPAP